MLHAQITVLVALSLLQTTSSFRPSVPHVQLTRSSSSTFHQFTNTILHAVVDLEPEPEGGEEMVALKPLLDCRMKKMEEVAGAKSEKGTVCKFWMTAVADGEVIKETRTKLLKEASKKANFPGFRKGQVPPYAQPQITQFSIQDVLIRTVEDAIEAYGLASLPGSDGEVTVHEDVAEMCKGYKFGTPIPFTASLSAAMPTPSSPSDEDENTKDTTEEIAVVEEAS